MGKPRVKIKSKAVSTVKREPTFTVNTGAMTKSMTAIQGVKDVPQEPVVMYTEKVAAQIEYIVDKCTKEVGWFHLVHYNEEQNTYLLYDTIIPEQTVSATETDISDLAWAKITNDLINANRAEEVGNMYAWFHSHVNMAVSPSLQDEHQIEDFLENAQTPAFIRGIVNKQGNSKVDVYYKDKGVAFTCVDEQVLQPEYEDWVAGLDEIIAANVKERSYTNYNYYGNGRNGNTQYSNGFRNNQVATLPTNSTLYDPIDIEDDYEELGFNTPLSDNLQYTDEEDTGYGKVWTVDTPISQRPEAWEFDPKYGEAGYHIDALAEDYYMANSPGISS